MDNKSTYEDKKVVNYYKNNHYLDKPEVAFLYRQMDDFKNKNMLDIGVGGGRTTHYFSDLVKEYVGIDYSSNMIEVCKQNYPAKKFLVSDVRDMHIFEDHYFDFVLFSFNGIDAVGHEDRLKALKEIKRVLKNEGTFFFSTHNLQSIDEMLSLKLSLSPMGLYTLYKNFRLKIRNKPLSELKARPYAIITDGVHNFRLQHYYIKPHEQILQLHEAGFKNVGLYSLNDGCQIKQNFGEIKDAWVHYLCSS